VGKVKSQAAVSLRAAVPCLVLLIGTAATAREKTDTLTLKNGDSITGEIVKLEYGKLAFKTSDLGTLSIAWNTVAALNSSYMFDGERPIPAFPVSMNEIEGAKGGARRRNAHEWALFCYQTSRRRDRATGLDKVDN
jgi:hypothetical protein